MTLAHTPGVDERRLLRVFHRAAGQVPAYAALLAERGAAPERVGTLADFMTLAPLLDKTNTFQRFPLDQLCAPGALGDLASVLTSSGHGGRFSYGLISRGQHATGPEMIDRAMDHAFAIDSRRTLAINCLPMGVVFSSHRMTVATVSVREDMAIGLVEAFAPYFEQLVLVGDPLFLKRLTDYAADQGVDWGRYRVNVVIGEEIFGEHYRAYLAQRLGLDPGQPQRGYIMSSMGVGELGLHLFFETPATIALRRAAHRRPEFCRALLGTDPADTTLPLLFTYHSERTFLEIVEPDRDGFGGLAVSLLEDEAPLPLLRYQTGDVGRLLDAAQVRTACARHGVPCPDALPGALLAIRGRAKEVLPNGRHVGQYKDALYARPELARWLSGAFRLEFSDGLVLHVQAARGRPG